MGAAGAVEQRSVLLVLPAADSIAALSHELSRAFPGRSRELAIGIFACDLESETAVLPCLAFARQILPRAREVRASSISTWASLLVDGVAGILPDHQPWSLHVYPWQEGSGAPRIGARAFHTRARAGEPRVRQPAVRAASGALHNRASRVREAAVGLLRKRRRHLVRYLRQYDAPFLEDEALVQLVMTSPEQGFLSVLPAPFPFRERRVLSYFPGGEVAQATDKQAPSRAFAKLVEAEGRMGRRIEARDTCVDLGASPGSWTYVAARRGARVTAVDRAELRADLMHHQNVQFRQGDAFRFEPAAPVDWLLCDVIASAERSSELLLNWLRRRWCRNFVLTLKVDHAGSSDVLWQLARDLPEQTSEFWLLRLCANKKEVCAFGTGRPWVT